MARAIVLEPKVLLFDEPLSNLDAKLRRHVREEIRELQQSLSLTAVYVTHDQQEALAISDRIMVMSMARIAQDGTPRDLYEQPNSHFVADFIGDANIVPVTIESRQGEMASVRLGPLLLTLPHHGAAEGAAELSIRPQALLLAPGGGGLSGRVTKAAYLGSHMEYWVTVAGLDKELFVIAPDVERPLVVGNMVSVSLAHTGAALVTATLTAGSVAPGTVLISDTAVPHGCVASARIFSRKLSSAASCTLRLGDRLE